MTMTTCTSTTPPGQPVPPPHGDTFDILFHIAEVAAELRAAKWFASANIIKDNANAVIDAWFGDEPITREEARARGICAACQTEATALLHGGELTFSQYVALAVAGPS